MIGIGTDIVSVSRLERLVANHRFCLKVFSPKEREYILEHSAASAAGIWAAKEAVSKALGSGFSGYTIRDIEIDHLDSGKPYVRLHNGAEDLFHQLSGHTIHLSISHEKEFAIAFAVAE